MLCYYGDENVNKVKGRYINLRQHKVKKQNGCQIIKDIKIRTAEL